MAPERIQIAVRETVNVPAEFYSGGMKTFLLIATWLGIAVTGYYGYSFYNKTLADAQASSVAISVLQSTNADLNQQVVSLKDTVAKLEAQLADQKRLAAQIALESKASAYVPTGPVQVPTSIPSTITTIYGKTYTGCVLSKVTPDGISFTHSMGVAKVPYTDLDPTFAAAFGYDPVAAKRYEADQKAQQEASDTARATYEALSNTTATALTAPVSNVPATASPEVTNQAQIAALQGQITALQSEAQSLDAGEEAEFNSAANIFYNSTGQVEHRHTLGHSQQADEDRTQIQELHAQIAKLQGN